MRPSSCPCPPGRRATEQVAVVLPIALPSRIPRRCTLTRQRPRSWRSPPTGSTELADASRPPTRAPFGARASSTAIGTRRSGLLAADYADDPRGPMPVSGDNAAMNTAQPARVPFDTEQYVRRSREGPCFICAILAGHPDYDHHDVYDDGD